MSDPVADCPESDDPMDSAGDPPTSRATTAGSPAPASPTDASESDMDAPDEEIDPLGDEALVFNEEDEATTGEEDRGVLDVLAATEAERDGHLADLQRVSAEFANFRRQAERRNVEISAVARSGLAEKLLPVLDACDLALEHGAGDVAPIRTSLVQALESAGLEVLDPDGESFDPNNHEAVLHEPADEGAEGQVVAEVLRRGYAWEGRVLRPAMVRVRG